VTPHILGVLFALLSAVVWGTGDFSGGIATRSKSQFQVLLLVSIPGIAVLAVFALLFKESAPSANDVFWSFSAGLSGAFGITALYKGLSLGNAAAVAPTAAVIGAGLPVAFSFLELGLPGSIQILGFIMAITGIWLVSRPSDSRRRASRQELILAMFAGIGFGGFFILIAQADKTLVFLPLVISKTAAIILAVTTLLFRSEKLTSSLKGTPIALVAGLFDAGGNIFFMLAKQYTRLDVAAVLASMYPGITVILAWLVLRENICASQWQGVALCVIAIALIGV
jgi:drug/metabolite transporter (DMT)-like permease